jgi:hypothetical protein
VSRQLLRIHPDSLYRAVLPGSVANGLFQSFSSSFLSSGIEDTVFKGRHFDRTVILLCVRWYLAYGLSLRNLEEMMAERGITVDHATVGRWVVRYSPESLERLNRPKRPVTRKWHVDFIPTAISVVTTSDVHRRSTLSR